MTRRLLLTLACVAWLLPATACATGYALTLPCVPRYAALARQGSALFVFCPDHVLHVLSLPGGRELHSMDSHPVMGGVLSPDGRRIALIMNDHRVQLLPLQDRTPARTLDAPKGMPWPIIFFGAHQVFIGKTLWDTESTHAIATFPTAFGPINAAAMSPDRTRLATAGGDTVVRIYDARSGKLLHRYTGRKLEPFGLAYTPDGSRLVVGGIDDRITVLDAATAKPLKTVHTGQSGVAAIVPLHRRGWLAVQYTDPHTNKPMAWRLVNIDTGTHRALCPGTTRVGISDRRAWCVRIKGKTLTAVSQLLPKPR